MNLAEARDRLRHAGVPDAPLVAELLLAHAAGTDRAGLLAGGLRDAPGYDALVERACRREPVAYILGRAEWHDLTLKVGPGVLVPSPDTELLLEEFLRRLPRDARRVADLGTGSGALALAIRRARPDVQVVGVDRSREALAWSRKNGAAPLVRADWCAGLRDLDAIVANPPYVAESEWALVSPERLHEPREALDGGADGLREIRRILAQAPGVLREGGLLALEIGFRQADNVRRLFEHQGAWRDVFLVPQGANDRVAGATCRSRSR